MTSTTACIHARARTCLFKDMFIDVEYSRAYVVCEYGELQETDYNN